MDTVAAMWRWPVKSMAGERVNALRVDGRGAGGDRTHAVLHRHKGEWRPLTAREAPRLLLASVAGDNFRVFGQPVKALTLTYAYGSGGVPPRRYHLGRVKPRRLPVGFLGAIELAEIHPCAHQLLGVETITASAIAILHRPLRNALVLGRVMPDYRGSLYTQTLT